MNNPGTTKAMAHVAEKSPVPADHFPRIPGYEVVQTLGKGLFSVVYRAVRLADSLEVALKVLDTQMVPRAQAERIFLRETGIHSGLRHPHIVEVLESGEWCGELYAVLEYVPGGNLADLAAAAQAPFDIARALDLFDQVLSALCYLHSQGVAHGDVKEHNILLDGAAGAEAVKLTDFGLARRTAGPQDGNDPSRRGYLCPVPKWSFPAMALAARAGVFVAGHEGVPSRLAPEQFVARRVDARTDVYRTAAALYSVLTGCTLWASPPGRYPVLQALYHTVVPIRTRRPDVPPNLAAVLHKALNRHPRDRFNDAQELRHALSACEFRRS